MISPSLKKGGEKIKSPNHFNLPKRRCDHPTTQPKMQKKKNTLPATPTKGGKDELEKDAITKHNQYVGLGLTTRGIKSRDTQYLNYQFHATRTCKENML